MTRQISEAIWIESCGNLNSRAEWGRNSLTRLVVENSSWDALKKHKEQENVMERELQEFKDIKKRHYERDNHVTKKVPKRPVTGARTCSTIRLRDP